MKTRSFAPHLWIGLCSILLMCVDPCHGFASGTPEQGSIHAGGLMETVSEEEARVAKFVDAGRRGDMEMLQRLLDQGMQVDAANRSGDTALIAACEEGRLDAVRLLLDRGAKITLRNKQGWSAFDKAFVGTRGRDIFQIMASKGGPHIVDRLVYDNEHYNWVKALLYRGDVEDLKWFLSRIRGGREFLVHEGGLTAACTSGNPETIMILLAVGADPNEMGGTPLLNCVNSRSLPAAKLILERGARVNEPSKCPPLWAAAHLAHVEMVKLLLKQRGANVNVKNTSERGTTPLIKSVSTPATKYDQVTRVLIEAGADLNMVDDAGRSPLMMASLNGREAAAKRLLDNGADLHAKTPVSRSSQTAPLRGGLTALCFAAASGSKSLVNLLLSKGARIDEPEATGRTPLMMALGSGSEDASRLLIEKGANVNVRTSDNDNCVLAAAKGGVSTDLLDLIWNKVTDKTILGINTVTWGMIHALAGGHSRTAQYFIDKGAPVDGQYVRNSGKPNEIRYTMLMVAAMGGDEGSVDLLIKRGLLVDSEMSDGTTALMLALANGHEEFARRLIEKGADTKHKTKNGYTMLMAASEGGVVKFVRDFLTNKLDVNAKTEGGSTALHYACEQNRIKAARLLCKNGADINAANKYGWTPLMIVAGTSVQDETLLQDLLAWKPQVNQQNNEGATALTLACEAGKVNFAELLLQNKADPNLSRSDGFTPLMLAVLKDSPPLVKTLVKSGARVNSARPQDGLTALAVTCKTGNAEIAEWLIKNGANPRAKLNDGRTLVEFARANNKHKVADVIARRLQAGAN